MRERIKNLIASGSSGLFIESHEHQRVEGEIASIVKELSKKKDGAFTLYTWTLTNGLVKHNEDPTKSEVIAGTEEPTEMALKFLSLDERSVVVAADFHLYFEGKNPMVIARVKDALRLGRGSNRCFIVLGCKLTLPAELEKEFAVITFELPDRATLGGVLDAVARNAGVALKPEEREAILDASAGLTTQEAEDAYALSWVEVGAICPKIVSQMKNQAVKKGGVLEVVESDISFDSVGGMAEAKDWMRRRKLAFSKEAKDYGLPTPKGVLVIGVQGCGKSLLAKATANMLNVPLLKMDGGKLFTGQVGGSEAIMRDVIAVAEAVSPCVLWLEEIDKALSGSKSSNMTDGGTSARVLGTFLTWMQEKTKPVFVVATGNDISQLPPELLRKGRWDELFFVDLPGDSERADIWKIHIESKGRKADDYDVPIMVQSTVGYSGAEIEAAYNEALFSAFEAKHEPHESNHIETAVKATVPISRTMAEEIEKLRTWATGRCRMASTRKAPAVVAPNSRKMVSQLN